MDPGQGVVGSPGGIERGEGAPQQPRQHGTNSPVSQHSGGGGQSRAQSHASDGMNGGCGCRPTFPPGFAQGCGGMPWTQVQQMAGNMFPGGQSGPCQQPMGQMGPSWFGAQWVPRGPPGMMPQGTGLNLQGGMPGIGVRPSGPDPSSSFPAGPSVGGLTPQAAALQSVMQMVGTLTEAQVQTLQQHLTDRYVTVEQRRQVPDRFGSQGPTGLASDPFFHMQDSLGAPVNGGGLIGAGGNGGVPGGGHVPLDIFAKSEKWLSPAPVPASSQWKTREEEIMQWSTYLDSLIGWAAQASLEFSLEIGHASRWPREILWSSLNVQQQARSRRLLAILKSAFSEHPRCLGLISAFCEGVLLSGEPVGFGSAVQQSNGFELLRQMTLEFSVRSRTEALSLRAGIASKSFVLSAQETSPSSVVSDTIRKVDFETARFAKLLGTLPSHVDTTGLRITEPDMLLILLRSLPETVRSYCMHHSVGDTYEAYRSTARRWEEQQRMFGDFGQLMSNRKAVASLEQQASGDFQGGYVETYDMSEQDGNLDALGQGERCSKCGSRKHQTQSCTVDLSKTKCFRCGAFGHVSLNCPKKSHEKGGEKGKKGVVQSDHWNKKGKGSNGFGNNKGSKGGKGKKGKMNEVSQSQENWDWSDWNWHVDSTAWDASDAWWYADGSGGNQEWQEWHDPPASSYRTDWDASQTWNASSGEQQSNGPVVGSLIISPCLLDGGLVLEPNSFRFVDDGSESSALSDWEVLDEPVEQAAKMFQQSGSSCDHFDRCGLRGPELSGESPDLTAASLDLVCQEPRRIQVHDFRKFFNATDELSVERQLEPFVWAMDPLLSQLADQTDSTWWLLDSGASTSVLAQSSASAFNAAIAKECPGGFLAANGSSVQMAGSAEIGVHMFMSDEQGGEQCWKKARMKVLVGNIRHNILSVTALADSGWKFTQGPNGFDLYHTRMGLHCLETDYFANCPWVRMYPSSGTVSAVQSGTQSQVSGSMCTVKRDGGVDLEQHRRQGHWPFHSQCLECARGRSVFQHRRKRDGQRETEIQADFMFLSQRGELSVEETQGAVKILLLVECFSSCFGAVVVREPEETKRQIKKWLDHFGVKSRFTAVVIHTDAEVAVGNLVGQASGEGDYTFHVRRAGPQQHASIGRGERAVRELKESLSVLRADLNQQGLDLVFSSDVLETVLTYLSLMHNHFSKAHGTDSSPLELSVGRRLSKPVVSLFGSCVLAELPDSVKHLSPNETRNVEAAYLHCGLDRGSLVQAKVRCEGGLELIQFTARNLRPISPLSWKLDLCVGLLTKLEQTDMPQGYIHDQLGVSHDPQGSEPVEDMSFHPLPVSEQRRLKSESLGVEMRQLVPPVVKERPNKGPGVFMRREAVGSKVVDAGTSRSPQGSPNSDGRRVSPSRRASEGAGEELRFAPTRNCPSCASGMNVPGTRHTAHCKRRFAEFQEDVKKQRKVQPEVLEAIPEDESSSMVPTTPAETPADSPQPMEVGNEVPPTVVFPAGTSMEYRQRFKRAADTTTEELEKEMHESSSVLQSDTCDTDFDWFWVGTGESVLVSSLFQLEGGPSFHPATAPDMFSGSLDAIQFDSHKEHEWVKMPLGKTEVLVWKPDSVVDDQTLQALDAHLGFLGMQEEIRNLETCKTGTVVGEAQVNELKRGNPQVRVIQSRWVAAHKSESRVRTRIVAKDFNKGSSAKALGFSSPTPSIESVHLVLTIACKRGYRLRSLDISHAFMHSPIRSGTKIVLRLPLSVSLTNGEASFMILDKALNGLRDASLCWLELLSNTVESVGLWNDSLEPCVYGGAIHDENGAFLGHTLAIVYVDDILLASSTEAAEEHVAKALGAVVPTKTTGLITPEEGGSLSFIGRVITRERNGSEIFLGVDPQYLNTTFEEYGVTKGRENVPDIASHLEKTMTDSRTFQKPLSDEAYSRFRRALGRLLWLSQVRHDLKAWLSLLGTQQQQPKHGTEQALKAILRFLFTDMRCCLCLPSRDTTLQSQVCEEQMQTVHLRSFSDASHGPYRFNGRKGLSGGAIFFEGGLVRSLSRQQQALSLSSCEAELYGLQSVSQESIAFSRVVHRLMFALGELDEEEPVTIFIESDSSAAILLLRSLDVPKRSRHVEIRLLWLREQLNSGRLKLKHRPGAENCSDIFTKCLSGKTFFKHRFSLGIIKPDGLLHDLLEVQGLCLVQQGPQRTGAIAFVELCCGEFSSLRQACELSQIPYVGVIANIQ